MSSMRFRYTLSADRLQLTMELLMDDETLGWIGLEAAGLDQLIDELAEQRAGMAVPVPEKIEPQSRISVLAEPGLHVQGLDGGQVGLALRHPGKGWVAGEFPGTLARALGEHLVHLHERTSST